jgi:hypothetical protein
VLKLIDPPKIPKDGDVIERGAKLILESYLAKKRSDGPLAVRLLEPVPGSKSLVPEKPPAM